MCVRLPFNLAGEFAVEWPQVCHVSESSRSLSEARIPGSGLDHGAVSVQLAPTHTAVEESRFRHTSPSVQGSLKNKQRWHPQEEKYTHMHINKGRALFIFAELMIRSCVFTIGKPGRQPWGQRGAEELDQQGAHLRVGRVPARQPGRHHLRH